MELIEQKKEIARQRSRAWYATNRERVRARKETNREHIKIVKAAYRAANKEQIKKYKKEYNAREKEQIREQRQAWRSKNRGAIKQYMASYRSKNKERIKDKRSEYFVAHRGEERINSRISKHKRRAKKHATDGRLSRGIVKKLLHAQEHRCVYCECNLSITGHHLDHITPLARGGLNIDANVQLLCPPCNLSKGIKTHDEFMCYRRSA